MRVGPTTATLPTGPSADVYAVETAARSFSAFTERQRAPHHLVGRVSLVGHRAQDLTAHFGERFSGEDRVQVVRHPEELVAIRVEVHVEHLMLDEPALRDEDREHGAFAHGDE